MSNQEHDSELLRRVVRIDHKTASMEDSLAWLVAANSRQLKDDLIKAFGSARRRVQVYLALDGSRNVNDIASHLTMHRQHVSRDLAWLRRKRLVDVLEAGTGGKKYTKKSFDAIVGLSAALAIKFKLNTDGTKPK